MGKIYYLMGKSASGKDHIYENLIQETALDLKPFVLYTTRPIRSGEQDAGLRLRHAAALAATLNPYGVLARGYALVQDEKGRICAPDALREGQKMTLCGAVNRIHCTVDAVEGPNESTQEL